MSQDSNVFSRSFVGIGLVLLVISVVIFYNQFTYTKNAMHTEGVIVDAVWYNNHSNDVGDNGSWYPVVAFRPTPNYTLIFNSSIGSDFYEDSEGDRVNVYYPHPEQKHENDPPGSTSTLGFISWAAAFVLFSWIFYYTTRFIYALKFAVAMTVANMGYQALCLYIDNSFVIVKISPLWAGLIGVCTFFAALLWTSKS
ncbi:DUF3592 domain-containing protein [Escherichia coli]|nr:DUF3592 domain-containing protein [Escherichia coli]MBB2329927.1 DUF3592 domain-containing protein [Escherichia sp. 93.0816]